MKFIDNTLHKITMYNLVAQGLSALAVVAIFLAAFGGLQFSALDMIITLGVTMTTVLITAYALLWLYGGTLTYGSTVITGLILFFIFSPGSDFGDWSVFVLLGVIAIASKYILAWNKRHLFNPAAMAAVIVGLIGIQQATWWVASEVLAIFVVILGFLILRKLHRFQLFFAFAIAAIVTLLITSSSETRGFENVVRDAFISFPLLFLGTVMLTEPMTTPALRWWQIGYGATVGVLFGSGFNAGGVYMTPELSLVLGNVVAYIPMLKRRVTLKLVEAKEVGPSIFQYRFSPSHTLSFTPGQYIDMTLEDVRIDVRGNRRSFSLASSPTEKEVVLGIKHNDPSSELKKQMMDLKKGQNIYVHQLSGTFTLPESKEEKLVFIAGGIGITPFRSMLKFLIDTKQTRDAVLFYQARTKEEFVFKSVIKHAIEFGVKPIMVLTGKDVPDRWAGETGFINKEMLEKRVPDFATRKFYISGPPGMVSSYSKMLTNAGVARSNITTDYFSGY